MIALFSTHWSHDKWQDILTGVAITSVQVNRMKEVIRGPGGTIDDRTAKLLTCIPVCSQMLEPRLCARLHHHCALR